jgi:hypothetical protein
LLAEFAYCETRVIQGSIRPPPSFFSVNVPAGEIGVYPG